MSKDFTTQGAAGGELIWRKVVLYFQPNGEGTGTASASDLLMLPIPQIMQPGVERAENLAPQRSQTSYPIVDRRLSVAAQNWEGSSRGSMDLLDEPR